MSYRIVYGKQTQRYSVRRFPHRKSVVYIVCTLLLFVCLHVTGVSAAIWRFLLPGDPAVTEAALIGMIQDISGGSDLSNSITAFCKEILNGAQIS